MEKKIKYAQARKKLLEACRYYLSHKHDQLAARPSSWCEEPYPGFDGWIKSNYDHILKTLFRNGYHKIGMDLQLYLWETYCRKRGTGQRIEYKGLRFLQGFENRALNNVDYVDFSEPGIVLHNLQALEDLFRMVMNNEPNKHVDCSSLKGELLGTLLKNNASLAKWKEDKIYRKRIFIDLFRCIQATDSQLTLGDILTATSIQFNSSECLLSFNLMPFNGPPKAIVWELNQLVIGEFFNLARSNRPRYDELFKDLIKSIKRDELPEKLCNLPLSHIDKDKNYSTNETISLLLSSHTAHSIGIELKKQCDLSEQRYLFDEDAPVSLKIYKKFEELRTLTGFGSDSDIDMPDIQRQLRNMSSTFESYIKGVAISELKDILANPDLDDEEAVNRAEAQLKDSRTLELLMKNRQSQQERDLKFLSVISILVGIGIFTTLALVIKRLFDSGGQSINFFKPLSQNLHETMESITSDLKTTTQP